MNAASPRARFAALLDAERRTQHLSIRDVARLADVPPATAQGWLSGKHLPVPALRRNYLRIVDRLGLGDHLPGDLWDDTWSGGSELGNPRNPYLGLRPFGTHDRDSFFGREEESRRLARAVRERREAAGHGLVVVLGASGSGKSSLLAAGLIATETIDGLLADWTVAQLSVAELPQVAGLDADLVVIDQAEELFAVEDDPAAALRTLEELAGRTVVVMAMRADAFAAAIQEPVLADAVARPFLIAPLRHDEIREVILGPAELAGTTVEDELVAMVLDDLPPGPQPGTVAVDVLPLLSSALMMTWAAGRAGRMTTADYVRAGGVAAAVQGLAEEVYQSLDEGQQEAFKRVMLRLVRLSGDLVVRDSMPLADIDPAARAAVDAFTAARMLTVTRDAVRISHDILVVQWSRLQDWIGENRADLATLERLRRAAQVWEDSGRSPDALVRIERLEAFSDWVDDARRDLLITPREREFIAASREHFASRLASEQRLSRRLRRGRNLAVGLTAVVSALAIVATLLYARGVELQAQTDLARRESQSRQVAVEARSLRAQDPNLVAQMALVAERLADTRQGASALLDATSMNVPQRWLGAPNAVIAKSPDGGLLARANGDSEVTIWRADELAASPGRTFRIEPAGPLFAVALASVAGRQLLAVGGVASAGLWDVTAEPTLVADLRDGDYTVYGAAFDASGERLALATSTGRVTLWSIPAGGTPTRSGEVELSPATPARGVVFHPVADELFVAGPGNAVARWQLSKTPRRLADLTFSLGESPVVSQAVAISPDGRQVAAGVAGRSVFRWRLQGEDALAEPALEGFSSWTNDVSYSADSHTLLVANSDQNAYLFDAGTGRLLEKLGGTTTVLGAEEVGGRPVTSGTDGALRVWQAENPVLRTGSSAYALAGDAGRQRLAVSTLADGIALWDTAGAPRRLPDPDAGGRQMSSGLAMAPDGSYLLGGTAAGEVLRWPLRPDGAGAVEVAADLPGWRVAGMAISPDASLVAALEYTGSRTALFGASGAGELTLLAMLDTPTPQGLSFSPDSAVLAVQADGDVQLWDVSEPARPALVRTLGVPTALVAVFANHSRLLAVGTVDGDVSVWEVADPSAPVQRRRYDDVRSGVNGFAFSPDDAILVAGGGDERVWAWRLGSDEPEAFLALDGELGRANDVRFIGDGGELVVAGNNGVVRRWQFQLDRARQSLCARRGDPLTPDEWRSYLPGVAPEDPC
ncbi:MAG: hypothetical protein QM804_04515 [Propionicimonas sp.]